MNCVSGKVVRGIKDRYQSSVTLCLGRLAQWIERQLPKLTVKGSTPLTITLMKKHFPGHHNSLWSIRTNSHRCALVAYVFITKVYKNIFMKVPSKVPSYKFRGTKVRVRYEGN